MEQTLRSEIIAMKKPSQPPQKVKRVHIVEDDNSTRAAIKQLLLSQGYEVNESANGKLALEAMEQQIPDILVTDLHMPVMDGITLLKELRKSNATVPVIVLTSNTDVTTAIAAMRAGAEDYLIKPVDIDTLALAIEQAIEDRKVKLKAETALADNTGQPAEGLKGLLGDSPAMQVVARLARQVAPSRATVLITGESGTGKGELARAIHLLSPRADKPFVTLHCAALAESILESELFGHEKGAFTGADKRRIGRFEMADGGTLFLDEIGEIPASIQVKLLSVLQDRRFERVGGNDTVQTDVRIIAATNKNLAELVQAGRFREDLFYRLNVVNIDMPPLRLRGDDVLALADLFLHRFAIENNKQNIKGFTERARAKVQNNRWPGNVRALENAIERAVVLCDGDYIEEEHLPFDNSTSPTFTGLQIPGSTMAQIEKFVILKTLEATGNSTAKTAEILDLGIRTIQYRLHEYGIARPRANGQKKLENTKA